MNAGWKSDSAAIVMKPGRTMTQKDVDAALQGTGFKTTSFGPYRPDA